MQEQSFHTDPPARTRSTASKELEDAPSGGDVLFADAFENGPVLIIIADLQGRIRVFNQACKALTGWHREEIIGRPLLDALCGSPARCTLSADKVRNAIASGLRAPITVTSPLAAGSGRYHQIQWTFSISAQGLTGSDAILAVGIDVTDHSAAENHVRRRHGEFVRHMYGHMLTALATLLSHEVSQPLSAVLAYIQGSLRLLAQEASASKEIAAYLDKAAIQARRAGTLARSMRSRNCKEVPACGLVDVNSVVAGVLTLAEADLMAASIILDLDCAPGLPRIPMNPRALEIMLFTLIQITIEALAATEAYSSQLRLATQRSGKSGAEIVLTLSGPETSSFRPSGVFVGGVLDSIALGFCTCRSILRDYGGDLDLKESADGITFVAALPEAEQGTSR